MEPLFGVGQELGVNVSSLLAHFNFTIQSREIDPIQGYGGIPTALSSRPFEPENIILSAMDIVRALIVNSRQPHDPRRRRPLRRVRWLTEW